MTDRELWLFIAGTLTGIGLALLAVVTPDFARVASRLLGPGRRPPGEPRLLGSQPPRR